MLGVEALCHISDVTYRDWPCLPLLKYFPQGWVVDMLIASNIIKYVNERTNKVCQYIWIFKAVGAVKTYLWVPLIVDVVDVH